VKLVDTVSEVPLSPARVFLRSVTVFFTHSTSFSVHTTHSTAQCYHLPTHVTTHTTRISGSQQNMLTTALHYLHPPAVSLSPYQLRGWLETASKLTRCVERDDKTLNRSILNQWIIAFANTEIKLGIFYQKTAHNNTRNVWQSLACSPAGTAVSSSSKQ